jgi:hypothetical protein
VHPLTALSRKLELEDRYYTGFLYCSPKIAAKCVQLSLSRFFVSCCDGIDCPDKAACGPVGVFACFNLEGSCSIRLSYERILL